MVDGINQNLLGLLALTQAPGGEQVLQQIQQNQANQLGQQQGAQQQQILGQAGFPVLGQLATTGVGVPEITKLIEQRRQQTLAPQKAAREERKIGLDEQKFGLELKKFERELAEPTIDPDEIFKRETKLRNEFTNLSKDFFKQRDAFGRVAASAQEPSAAGDLALIFNFMKVLDPGSTVREGEFATAQNSGSVPDRIQARYNSIIRGERLSDRQRNDFVNRSKKLFDSANRQHSKRVGQFSTLAARVGGASENVILDLTLAKQQADTEQSAQGQPATINRVQKIQRRQELRTKAQQ